MEGGRERERGGGGGVGARKSVLFGLSRGRKKNGRMKKKEKLTHSRSRSLFPFTPPSNLHEKPKTNRKKKTVEDVLNVVEKCRPDGIIVQFGGQTPLKLATPLAEYLKANPIPAASGEGNVRIWGTQPESIDAAEDRDLWYELLRKLEIKQPPGTMVSSEEAALKAADSLGYPVMVRKVFRFFSPLQRALDARGFFVSEEGERKSKTKKKNTKNSLFSLSSKKKKKKKKNRSAPPSSSAGAPWRSSTRTRTCRGTSGTPSRSTRTSPCWWTRCVLVFSFFLFFVVFWSKEEREKRKERENEKNSPLSFFLRFFFKKLLNSKQKQYLDRADEIDVDALCDKDGNVTICGIMQHIEQVKIFYFSSFFRVFLFVFFFLSLSMKNFQLSHFSNSLSLFSSSSFSSKNFRPESTRATRRARSRRRRSPRSRSRPSGTGLPRSRGS